MTYLTPTAVLCNNSRGREKEAMEVQNMREERLPPPHRDCRQESRLASPCKDTPAQGRDRAAAWRCKGCKEQNGPKGRQGSCPNFNSLWDSWRDCSQLQPKALKRPETSQLQYASSAAAFPRAGLASLAKSGHRPRLMPLLDSNLFMYSQHRPAEVFLHLVAWMYFVVAETLLLQQPGAERMHRRPEATQLPNTLQELQAVCSFVWFCNQMMEVESYLKMIRSELVIKISFQLLWLLNDCNIEVL